jgi:DNA helicase HerA-like ATPase
VFLFFDIISFWAWLFPPVRKAKPVQTVEQTPPRSETLRVSEDFEIDPKTFNSTGERDAILASSGMGKSYLTGVIIEETLETGGLVCVIDPEGEHHTLAARYPMLVVGGDHASIPLPTEGNTETRIREIIDTILRQGVSAVFDLSDFADSGQREAYALIASVLFDAETEAHRKIRLIVEEAQIYAPQTGAGSDGVHGALAVSRNIAKRGRKRALDSLWATQRPASLNKDILSQCNRFWFGGIQAEQDYKAIKPFLDQAGISFDAVRELKPGEFFCYFSGKSTKIKVRKRYCKHGGSTPQPKKEMPIATKKDMGQILAKLK